MAAQLSTSSSHREQRPPLCTPLEGEHPWIEDAHLLVRLARDADEVRAAQRVRHQVFVKELQNASTSEGVDEDRFDDHCDHLLLIDRISEEIVGTYRLQTARRARAGIGFYCDQEFVLDDFPAEVVEQSIELGRAC
ncbi:MAG: GNAT family N-acetyltransferase, partial [Planctomycetota bacterium]